MSSDSRVLLPVLKALSLRERLDIAALDSELCNDVLSFHDITSASIREDGVVLANRLHQLGRGEKTLLDRMTNLDRVVVERSLEPEEWQQLLGIKKLRKIYLSSLDGLEQMPQEVKINQESIKTLYILQSTNRPPYSMGRLNEKNMNILLSPSLTRICLTGLRLLSQDLPRLFSLPNLCSLDLIGCLVNSESIPEAQKTLKVTVSLEELSLPPSWFSFGTAYPKGYKKHEFGWLSVPKLCLYVHNYDKNLFWYQLVNYMPKGMDTLVLYGNHAGIKEEVERGKRMKFDVLFGPNQSQYLTFRGLGDTSLVSHLIKKPPFVIKQTMDYMNWQYRPSSADKIPSVKKKLKSKKTTRRRLTGRGRVIRRPRDQVEQDDLETSREPEGEMRTAREPRRQSRPRRSSRGSRSGSRSRGDRPTRGVSTAREISPAPVVSSSSVSVQVSSRRSVHSIPAQTGRNGEELDQEQ